MNKMLIAVGVFATATAIFADESAKELSNEKVSGVERLGGMVETIVPKDSKYVVLIDKTAKGGNFLTEFSNKLSGSCHIANKTVEATDETLANKNGDLVIVLVETGVFSIFPEKKIAYVSMESSDIQKALWEALAYLTTSFEKPIAQSVISVASGAKAYGIPFVRRVPYLMAVRQGWAPAPTNDIQKAIWEKVKAEKEAAAKPAEETETK